MNGVLAMVSETPALGLLPAVRASLEAKLERLLRRPLVATLREAGPPPATIAEPDEGPDLFRELLLALEGSAPTSGLAQLEVPLRQDSADGTCRVRIFIDYSDLWRGREREVLEAVSGTVENNVTFLTEEQQLLLERSPREFLALNPRPECAELVSYRTETVGGSERVVELQLAEPPRSMASIRSVAIVPNLVPLERQLQALHVIDKATDTSDLAPLRVLLGLAEADEALASRPSPEAGAAPFTDRLDTYQQACVRTALSTPHFAVIQGPPGSGKTTVITTVIRHALERGDRVLVVSPTHVAVDNVVEKLAHPGDPDDLESRTLPVRYAARPRKLLDDAAPYWIGPRKQRRNATVARRLERRLRDVSPVARELLDRVDDRNAAPAPLSEAIAGMHDVICGTPIGILSFDSVKYAEPGEFDLLVVDEVSKMTLPEFLAVAVKAKRWVLVGDPEQLPPYNDAEESGTTLDDVLDPHLELVCSVGAILERCKPGLRPDLQLAVVSSDPEAIAAAVSDHIREVGLDGAPRVLTFTGGTTRGVVACTESQVDEVVAVLAPAHGRDRTHDPRHRGSVRILVERGLEICRPAFASGSRLVEPRDRAPARVFDTAFNVYHAQPWQRRASQKLMSVKFRRGLAKYLPSAAALASLAGDDQVECRHHAARAVLVDQIAERYALNAVSVYDWLTGIHADDFDAAPLRNLDRISRAQEGLRRAVEPHVGTLRIQYRMHASLSEVPRKLFYFGEALEDGLPNSRPGCRVRLVQVEDPAAGRETNRAENEAICRALAALNRSGQQRSGAREHILVITPYRAQERELAEAIAELVHREGLAHIDVEVCTLDRCQGREADYVFVSLVRNRATAFLDAPKRWNVALTRAKEGLFLFGDIDAFLRKAAAARRFVSNHPWSGPPSMSLLARLLEAYDRQIAGGTPHSRRTR